MKGRDETKTKQSMDHITEQLYEIQDKTGW